MLFFARKLTFVRASNNAAAHQSCFILLFLSRMQAFKKMGPHVRDGSPTQTVSSMTFEDETSVNLLTPSKPQNHHITSESKQQTANTLPIEAPLPFSIHFIAGGLAGTIGAVITCPRLQSSHYQKNMPRQSVSFMRYPMKASWSHIKSVVDSLRYLIHFDV
jgi:hypothetical protein